jgi:general secretion pathway protein H
MTRSTASGFTLLELVVVLFIAGLFFALGGPSVRSLSDTMEYREAVRELSSAAKNGRRHAFATGEPIDLLINADKNRFALTANATELGDDEFTQLSDSLDITVVYAAEVSPQPGLAAIRFYPSGGSSGGKITVMRPSGAGVQLTIDWLLGDLTRETL